MSKHTSFLFPALLAVAAVSGFDPARARVIEGTGDGLLPCPGLRSVEAVLVGEHLMDPQITNKYPLDRDAKEHVTQTVPLYDLVDGPDGVPVLVRSPQSNDGIWQAGLKITVVGDWGPPTPLEAEIQDLKTATSAKTKGEK